MKFFACKLPEKELLRVTWISHIEQRFKTGFAIVQRNVRWCKAAVRSFPEFYLFLK